MTLYAISDLHIDDPHDPLYGQLLQLIQKKAMRGDVVVLAGDLFDLFVGSKQIFLDRFASFFSALREAGQRGVHIHYIQGNHDFFMEKALKKLPLLKVSDDEVSIDMGGKRFFIAHGDLADRGNVKYLLLRSFLRSPVMRTIVKASPGSWIDAVGKKSSQMSRESRHAEARDSELETLRKVYRNFAAERLLSGFDFVILGHCHDLDEISFQIGDRKGQYINVGYPRIHQSFLRWSPGDERIGRESLTDL